MALSERFLFGALILVVTGVVAVLVLYRFTRSDYRAFGETKSFMAVMVLIFIGLMLALYAFQEKEWTADLLKVLVGILAGGGAVAAANTYLGAYSGNTQTISGDNNFQTLHAQIEKLSSELSSIERVTANELSNIYNVTQTGFARFDTGADALISIGRLKFRYTVAENPDLRDYVGPSASGKMEDLLPAGEVFQRMSEMERYALAFLYLPDFRSRLERFLDDIRASGLEITSSEGWDNVSSGIEFYFRVGKKLG